MLKSALLALTLLGGVPVLAAATPAAAVALAPAAQLKALFHESDEAQIKRNPISALFRGDPRYADRFGDYISDAYYAAERQAAVDDLAALAKIDRSALGTEDRISYDTFKWQRTTDLKGYDPALLRTQTDRPIDHFSGFQTLMPDLSSGEGAAPFKTVAD